jgi:hypothetical protein
VANARVAERASVPPGATWSRTARAVTVGLVLAWIALLGWSAYEIVQTRTSSTDNSWFWPLFTVWLALLVVSVSGIASSSATKSGVRRLMAGLLAVAGVVLAGTVWVVLAPLPQLRAVPLPPPTATPVQVVQAFVAALDAHDLATARSLCIRDTPGCSSLDNNVWVAITHIGPVGNSGNDGFVPKGAAGVFVPVQLSGRTRSGVVPGEGGAWDTSSLRWDRMERGA